MISRRAYNHTPSRNDDRMRFDPVRTLLEDFVGVADRVLVGRMDADRLGPPLKAAVIAQTMRLKSIDYALRRYVLPNQESQVTSEAAPFHSYIAAYQASKRYIFERLGSLVTEGRRDPTVGEFGASIALERLPHSFFSAHLLYRLGHRYEGHAVSRHILEQIAWAYAAGPFDDVDSIASIVTTRTISSLNKFLPKAGKLYGFLSHKTHIDYSSHFDFLHTQDGKSAIWLTQPEYAEYADVLLSLADMFGAVWEATQLHFVVSPEAVRVQGEHVALNEGRPFISISRTLLDAVLASSNDAG